MEMDEGDMAKPSLLFEYLKCLLSGFGETALKAIGTKKVGREDVTPTASLEEIRELSLRVEQWSHLLGDLVAGFSQVNPVFSSQILNLQASVNKFYNIIYGRLVEIDKDNN